MTPLFLHLALFLPSSNIHIFHVLYMYVLNPLYFVFPFVHLFTYQVSFSSMPQGEVVYFVGALDLQLAFSLSVVFILSSSLRSIICSEQKAELIFPLEMCIKNICWHVLLHYIPQSCFQAYVSGESQFHWKQEVTQRL